MQDEPIRSGIDLEGKGAVGRAGPGANTLRSNRAGARASLDISDSKDSKVLVRSTHFVADHINLIRRI
jgi:hypothetical protein